jgi:hypothetical protein
MYKSPFQQQQFKINPKQCFVLMPFDMALRNVYEVISATVKNRCGLDCLRADELYMSNQITDDIWNCINEARFLIADLTGLNANVFYEVGLAHALKKPIILLAQKREALPFDVRGIRCIEYDPDDLASLEELLFRSIKDSIHTIPRDWNRNFNPSNNNPYIKIISLESPQSISVGEPFEITLRAINNGREADEGYFSVSVPYEVDNLYIDSTITTKVGVKKGRWSSDHIILDYPIAEGYTVNWASRKEYQITVSGKAKSKGLLLFYVNASCRDVSDNQWWCDPPERILDVDQRNENVYCGVIEVI